MIEKVVVSKLRSSYNQKRVNIPKQNETDEWEDGDLIKLEKVVIE